MATDEQKTSLLIDTADAVSEISASASTVCEATIAAYHNSLRLVDLSNKTLLTSMTDAGHILQQLTNNSGSRGGIRDAFDRIKQSYLTDMAPIENLLKEMALRPAFNMAENERYVEEYIRKVYNLKKQLETMYKAFEAYNKQLRNSRTLARPNANIVPLIESNIQIYLNIFGYLASSNTGGELKTRFFNNNWEITQILMSWYNSVTQTVSSTPQSSSSQNVITRSELSALFVNVFDFQQKRVVDPTTTQQSNTTFANWVADINSRITLLGAKVINDGNFGLKNKAIGHVLNAFLGESKDLILKIAPNRNDYLRKIFGTTGLVETPNVVNKNIFTHFTQSTMNNECASRGAGDVIADHISRFNDNITSIEFGKGRGKGYFNTASGSLLVLNPDQSTLLTSSYGLGGRNENKKVNSSIDVRASRNNYLLALIAETNKLMINYSNLQNTSLYENSFNLYQMLNLLMMSKNVSSGGGFDVVTGRDIRDTLLRIKGLKTRSSVSITSSALQNLEDFFLALKAKIVQETSSNSILFPFPRFSNPEIVLRLNEVEDYIKSILSSTNTHIELAKINYGGDMSLDATTKSLFIVNSADNSIELNSANPTFSTHFIKANEIINGAQFSTFESDYVARVEEYNCLLLVKEVLSETIFNKMLVSNSTDAYKSIFSNGLPKRTCYSSTTRTEDKCAHMKTYATAVKRFLDSNHQYKNLNSIYSDCINKLLVELNKTNNTTCENKINKLYGLCTQNSEYDKKFFSIKGFLKRNNRLKIKIDIDSEDFLHIVNSLRFSQHDGDFLGINVNISDYEQEDCTIENARYIVSSYLTTPDTAQFEIIGKDNRTYKLYQESFKGPSLISKIKLALNVCHRLNMQNINDAIDHLDTVELPAFNTRLNKLTTLPKLKKKFNNVIDDNVDLADVVIETLLDKSLKLSKKNLEIEVQGPSGVGKSHILYGKNTTNGLVDLLKETGAGTTISFFEIYGMSFPFKDFVKDAFDKSACFKYPKLSTFSPTTSSVSTTQTFKIDADDDTLEVFLANKTLKANIDVFRRQVGVDRIRATENNNDSSRSILLCVLKTTDGSIDKNYKNIIDIPGSEAIKAPDATTKTYVELLKYNVIAGLALIYLQHLNLPINISRNTVSDVRSKCQTNNIYLGSANILQAAEPNLFTDVANFKNTFIQLPNLKNAIEQLSIDIHNIFQNSLFKTWVNKFLPYDLIEKMAITTFQNDNATQTFRAGFKSLKHFISYPFTGDYYRTKTGSDGEPFNRILNYDFDICSPWSIDAHMFALYIYYYFFVRSPSPTKNIVERFEDFFKFLKDFNFIDDDEKNLLKTSYEAVFINELNNFKNFKSVSTSHTPSTSTPSSINKSNYETFEDMFKDCTNILKDISLPLPEDSPNTSNAINIFYNSRPINLNRFFMETNRYGIKADYDYLPDPAYPYDIRLLTLDTLKISDIMYSPYNFTEMFQSFNDFEHMNSITSTQFEQNKKMFLTNALTFNISVFQPQKYDKRILHYYNMFNSSADFTQTQQLNLNALSFQNVTVENGTKYLDALKKESSLNYIFNDEEEKKIRERAESVKSNMPVSNIGPGLTRRDTRYQPRALFSGTP